MFRPRKRKPSEKKQRSPEFYARQATRTVRSRTFWLMLVMGILLFVILFFQLYHLQITRHQEMQTRALDQQTRQTVVSAFRGTIYDRNGSQLAVSVSTETVFLSPKDLKEQLDAEEERLAEIRQKNASLAEGETPLSEESQVHWTYDSLAASLSGILGVSQDTIRSCMDRTDSQYEVLAKKVDEDVADQIRQLINDTDVHGVYMVADAKRVYPYGSLASHVLGFVGTDNTGLYGLESRYDKYLQGQTGLVVTAKDERGNPLPYEYEQYFAAENGQDLVLTLDANVQYYLEKYVGEMADKYGAEHGATGIVMDVKTGGILGMVSYPTYDVNDAFTVQNDLFKKNLTDTSDQLLKQWRNKALNDTYEPGSTFKILTMSAAMEEGLINMNTTYTCTGVDGLTKMPLALGDVTTQNVIVVYNADPAGTSATLNRLALQVYAVNKVDTSTNPDPLATSYTYTLNIVNKDTGAVLQSYAKTVKNPVNGTYTITLNGAATEFGVSTAKLTAFGPDSITLTIDSTVGKLTDSGVLNAYYAN